MNRKKIDWTPFYRKLCKVIAKEFEWNKGCRIGANGNYEKCEDCMYFTISIGINPLCIDHG